MIDLKSLSVALIAGIACVLMVASAQTAGVLGIPLLMLAAFPIYAVALAWGTAAAVASSIIAIIVSATAITPATAVFIGLAYTIPASIVGYQANLAQELEDGSVEWYPLSSLFLNLCILLAIGLVVLGFFAGFTPDNIMPELKGAVKELLKQNPPPTPMTDADVTTLTERIFRILPFMAASFWLIVHVANAYLAALACRVSGMLPRPKDDIPATVSLPMAALIIMVLSLLAAAFGSGAVKLAAGAVAGVFITAFALVGLATIHFRTRSNSTSFIFLMLSYLTILIFYFPLFLFAFGGIFRTINLTKSNPPQAGNDNSRKD